MSLPATPPSSERRSAQIIYPAAFHPPKPETPQEWAAEAVRQHLAARGQAFDVIGRGDWPRTLLGDIATPDAQLVVRFDHQPGRFDQVTFGAGLAFTPPAAIVAPLPQPPRSWMARLFGAAR